MPPELDSSRLELDNSGLEIGSSRLELDGSRLAIGGSGLEIGAMQPGMGVAGSGGRDRRAREIREIAASLHDMCQPLTALQCRLEIGQMFATTESYEEAIREALHESERLVAAVAAMRELVRRVQECG